MANGAQMDGTGKLSHNKLKGAAPTWNLGICSLLCARKKSWVPVCSLSVGSPYRVRLEVTGVHTNRFRSQEGTSQTLLGTVAASPLQRRPLPRHGKRVASQLRKAHDEVGWT